MKKYFILGKALGYPDCCIHEFVNMALKGDFPTHAQAEAGDSTGFIPCKKHTQEVLTGEVKLEELIKNRKVSTPFPKVMQAELYRLLK